MSDVPINPSPAPSLPPSGRFRELIAAAFTPMRTDGSLHLELIEPLVAHLVKQGVTGFYVCGSTGEGPLLSTDERKRVAEAYVEAAQRAANKLRRQAAQEDTLEVAKRAAQAPTQSEAQRKMRVIVHVGHESLTEAAALARHAESIGADAIASLPPSYFKCDSVDTLIDWLGKLASAAPSLPLYYYHIPPMSGYGLSMTELLEKAPEKLPALAGIKFSSTDLVEFHACVERAGGRYDLYFGVDEMLLSAVVVGATGAVGSTYNFAAPLYLEMINAYKAGELERARRLQAHAVRMVEVFGRYRGLPAIKATMKLVGIDCGPNRLPLRTLSADEFERMRSELAPWFPLSGM